MKQWKQAIIIIIMCVCDRGRKEGEIIILLYSVTVERKRHDNCIIILQ